MLSVKYHIAYWAAAISAATIYQLLAFYNPITKVLLRIALGPLALHVVHSCWNWESRSKKTHLALALHRSVVAELLLAIGSVVGYFQTPIKEALVPEALTHTLLAFMVCGTLESLRQNRRDIEPGSFQQVLRGPRSQLARFIVGYPAALFLFDLLLFGILGLANRVLDLAWGTTSQCLLPFNEQSKLDVRGRFGSALVSIYLGGPFADMAETAFYVLCRTFIPEWRGWMPREGPLLKQGEPFSLLDTEQGLSTFVWVVYVSLSYCLGQ